MIQGRIIEKFVLHFQPLLTSKNLYSCLIIAEKTVPDLTVHWQESYYSASETDGSVELCAELSTVQFEGSVQVDYGTVGDSAKGV